jgi:creatinine amidohydrolase/Fe(II)-dependent formamide hydrolase-like protein
MIRSLAALSLVTISTLLAPLPNPVSPDPNTPRPIAAMETVFIEQMTWMEVRDALKSGTKTVIVATGGVEQNGPYLAAGKHNYILQATTAAIAKKLGKTLVAPIVPFVPEGNIFPPTGHMKYPSTIGVTEATFRALLTDIVASLKTHGFENIILIGDSGGNQKGMQAVAGAFNTSKDAGKTRVHFIPEYYNHGDVSKWLVENGIKQTPEGLHDDFAMGAVMMVVDPNTVRMKERIEAGKFHINGVNLAPAKKTIEWGKRIIDFRAEATVKAIRKSIASAQQ